MDMKKLDKVWSEIQFDYNISSEFEVCFPQLLRVMEVDLEGQEEELLKKTLNVLGEEVERYLNTFEARMNCYSVMFIDNIDNGENDENTVIVDVNEFLLEEDECDLKLRLKKHTDPATDITVTFIVNEELLSSCICLSFDKCDKEGKGPGRFLLGLFSMYVADFSFDAIVKFTKECMVLDNVAPKKRRRNANPCKFSELDYCREILKAIKKDLSDLINFPPPESTTRPLIERCTFRIIDKSYEEVTDYFATLEANIQNYTRDHFEFYYVQRQNRPFQLPFAANFFIKDRILRTAVILNIYYEGSMVSI